jgi:hypothetical protein
MLSPRPPSAHAEATLALLLPLIERLDREHAREGRYLYEQLQALSSGRDGISSNDPRIEPQLALMRQAFIREASAPPGVLFQSWSDLHNHLRFALVPFGRALIDLHSEAAIAQPPLDALMLAAGLTAVLQQAPQRFRATGQVLLPANWFPAGADIAVWLGSTKGNLALDTAYGNGLSRLDEMLLAAERGVSAMHNEGLRRGVTASLFLLRRLRKRLSKRTPNTSPIIITMVDRLLLRWRY